MTFEISKSGDEDEIRRQIDHFVTAFCTKDLDLMMSLYAPEMVSYDIVPPLQDAGRDTYKNVWEKTFTLFGDSIDIDIRDLRISTGGNVAFSHNLLRIHGTKANGQKIDYWERLTLCFRKIDNNWLVVHEHVSVPVDFENGKAMVDLKP